jgi:hypothetical protein
MDNDEVSGIQDELKDLALRSLVLTAKATIVDLEERFGPIDLRSFLIGGVVNNANANDLPSFITAQITAEIMESLEPYIAAETSIEGAFDDLPTYDPGNGS